MRSTAFSMVRWTFADLVRSENDASPRALLRLLHRWRDEAVQAGRTITRIAVAFEAGRDGFWLARWLRARGIEAYVIHPTSIGEPRPIGSTPPCSSGPSWAGCVASPTTAAWRRSPPWRTRTPSARAAS